MILFRYCCRRSTRRPVSLARRWRARSKSPKKISTIRFDSMFDPSGLGMGEGAGGNGASC